MLTVFAPQNAPIILMADFKEGTCNFHTEVIRLVRWNITADFLAIQIYFFQKFTSQKLSYGIEYISLTPQNAPTILFTAMALRMLNTTQ